MDLGTDRQTSYMLIKQLWGQVIRAQDSDAKASLVLVYFGKRLAEAVDKDLVEVITRYQFTQVNNY